MKRIMAALTALLTVLIIAANAFALSLDEAKRQGLVGEMRNGYLGVVNQSSNEAKSLVNQINEAKSLVNQINAQRKAKYAQIAQKNGTSVAAVEALAGQKAIQQTAPGNYVQSQSGAWTKK